MVSGNRQNDLIHSTSKYSSNMSFQRKESSTYANKNEGRHNGNSTSFRTDAAIFAGRNLGERTLQRWVSDAPAELDGSLETTRNKPVLAWDQFAENNRLFGLTTDYDENIYTTPINTNHPEHKKRVAEADRKAREIETSNNTNPHVAEERILNNVGDSGNGTDEEEKYSGVQRQQAFPAISNSSTKKYLPPGRRAISVLSSSAGVSVDPAIISSQLARPDRLTVEKTNVSVPPAKSKKPDVMTPPTSDSSFNVTPESKSQISPVNSTKKNATTVSTEPTIPIAAATVVRNVTTAFKIFGSGQRINENQERITRAKNDKEVKLNDLKAFATSFKLHTPVPSDLVSIIAKDPKKQKEIQAKARRNVEEAEANKAGSSESSKATSTSDVRANNRPLPLTSQTTLSSNAPSRQHNGRSHQVSFRASSQQPSTMQQIRASLGNRIKDLDQTRTSQLPPNPTPSHDIRFVPSDPSKNSDTSRFSKVTNTLGARLNPNSSEFRPSPHAASFNPSSGSSPQSTATCTIPAQVSRSLLRRTPILADKRPSITGYFDILQYIKSITPPSGKELAWKATGDLKPAYDTQPIWKQATAEDKADSPIRLSYNKVFDSVLFKSQTLSPLNPSHVFPQVPHQHQLPIRLQTGAPTISARHSPRQSPMSLHGTTHGMPPAFNVAHDDHRMIASHSAQSFTSPRFQSVPIGYLSPLNQSSQLAYNPQMVQYSNAPPMLPGHRSLSNSHFLPQQSPLGPIMMPNPSGTFLTSQGIAPSPQIMFQGNHPPPFLPSTNSHPPPIPGMNGYPSPGRSAHMVSQISQGHQQPMYGMNPGISPGPNYGNPMFAQQSPPVQMPIRPFSGPNSHSCGATPQQLHLYGPQNRRNHPPNGSYINNKSFHHVQPQIGTTSQSPPVSQARGSEVCDEAK